MRRSFSVSAPIAAVFFAALSTAPALAQNPSQIQPKIPSQVQPKIPSQVQPEIPSQVQPEIPSQVQPKVSPQVLPQNPPVGGGPAAGYVADFKLQNYGPKVRGRVYGAPGKERRETPDPWGGTTLILRYDLGLAWTIYPGGAAYVEYPLRQAGVPAPAPGGPPPGLTAIESDDINDVPARNTRFRPPAPGRAAISG